MQQYSYGAPGTGPGHDLGTYTLAIPVRFEAPETREGPQSLQVVTKHRTHVLEELYCEQVRSEVPRVE